MTKQSWALLEAADADASLKARAEDVLREFAVGAAQPHEVGLLEQLRVMLEHGRPAAELSASLSQLSMEGYLRGAVTLLADDLVRRPRAEVALLLARELSDALHPALGVAVARSTLMLPEVARSAFERAGPYVQSHLLLGEQLESFAAPSDAIRHYEAVLATDIENRRAMSGWSRCNRSLSATGDLDIGRRVGLSMLEGIDELETDLDLGRPYDLGPPWPWSCRGVPGPRHVGRDVAIKRLLAEPSGADRGADGWSGASSPRSPSAGSEPYVVALYDARPEQRFAHGALPGGSLRLARRGLIEPEALVRFLNCGQRSTRCGRGAVHRDVKPANILLRDAAAAHPIALADFGLAVDTDSEETAGRERAGTLRYMAPELRRGGDARPSPASDRFAAGVVLLEIALAPAPLPGAFDRISTDLDAAALIPASVPERWRRRLSNLLDPDPERRSW